MNWDFIGHKTGEIFLESFIIITSYFLSKELLSYRKSINKSTLIEKFWKISKRIIVSIIAAYLLSIVRGSYFEEINSHVSKETFNNWGVIYFFIIIIPATLGAMDGFAKDSKLSEDQRKKRIEINKWKSRQADAND